MWGRLLLCGLEQDEDHMGKVPGEYISVQPTSSARVDGAHLALRVPRMSDSENHRQLPEEVSGGGWTLARTEGTFELVHVSSQQTIRSVDPAALFALAAFVGYAGAVFLPEEIGDPTQLGCPIQFVSLEGGDVLFETFGAPPKQGDVLNLPKQRAPIIVLQVEWTYREDGARSTKVLCEPRQARRHVDG